MRTPDNFLIYLGLDVQGAGSMTKALSMDRYIIHDKYASGEAKDDHDIALIHTPQAIEYKDKIKPVALPISEVIAGSICTATGWGKTSSRVLKTIFSLWPNGSL